MPLHLDEIKLLLHDQIIDVLALNETRLHNNISNDLVNIDNYTLIRKDRNRFGGGICLFVHSRNKILIKDDLINKELNHEIMTIDVIKPNSKPFGVCAFYRPPNSNRDFFDSLEKIIQKYDSESRELILLGDINCNQLTNSRDFDSLQIKSFCDTYQIKQLITEPTRITQFSKTLIDVIFTNEPRRIVSSGVRHLGISDHSLIFAIRKFSKGSDNFANKNKYHNYRCFKHFDPEKFREELANINWTCIDDIISPSEMLLAWERLFLEIANKHAPIKSKRVRHTNSPWLTSDLKQLIHHRNYLKKQATKTSDPQAWVDFKQLRNTVNNEIKTAKTTYFREKIENNKGNPKALWKTINSLSGRTKTKSGIINEIKFENSVFSNPKDISEILNCFFSEVGGKLSSELARSTTKYSDFLEQVEARFSLQPITVDFVIDFLNKMSADKTTGLDNIPSRLLKEATPVIAPSITNIINKSLSQGIFPNTWKVAKVIPLHKANDRDDPTNYRPISILPILSKVCERAVFNQLYNYFTTHQLLTKYQSGFRPLHSTLTALLDATNEWYTNMDEGLTNLVVALDLAKAFDTVSHQILIEKLHLYGVDGVSLDFFKSYLSDRKQCCIVQNEVSEPKSISHGVPQGSILGPLLFIIYINDIPCCLDHTKPRLYADDTIISIASKSATELHQKINYDLARVSDWLLANKLSLNVVKSEYILIGSKFKVPSFGSFAPIRISGSEIKRVSTLKHLGVLIDENLNWESHIDTMCLKIGRSIYGLKLLRDFVPVSTLITMYKSLIQPNFDYCDLVWSNLNKGQTDRLQKLQNRAARIITFQGYDVRSADLLERLKWDKLEVRRKKRMGLMMHDIVNNKCPLYLSNLFASEEDVYKSKLRNNNMKIKLIPKTDFFKSSFYYRGSTMWNTIPNEIKTADTKTAFKNKLYKWCEVVNTLQSF